MCVYQTDIHLIFSQKTSSTLDQKNFASFPTKMSTRSSTRRKWPVATNTSARCLSTRLLNTMLGCIFALSRIQSLTHLEMHILQLHQVSFLSKKVPRKSGPNETKLELSFLEPITPIEGVEISPMLILVICLAVVVLLLLVGTVICVLKRKQKDACANSTLSESPGNLKLHSK